MNTRTRVSRRRRRSAVISMKWLTRARLAGAYPALPLCGATRKPENRWRSRTRYQAEGVTIVREAKPGTGSGRPGRLSVCLGLLARRMQRLTGRALRLLVFGHRTLRLVRLWLFGFFVVSHLTLRHRFLLDAGRPSVGL